MTPAFLWLRGWDSNPEPMDYSSDCWTMSSPFFLRGQALRSQHACRDLLPCGIVSTPSRHRRAWLGVGEANVHRIHLVFPLPVTGKGCLTHCGFPLEFIPHSMRGGNDTNGASNQVLRPSSDSTVHCSTVELPRNIFSQRTDGTAFVHKFTPSASVHFSPSHTRLC